MSAGKDGEFKSFKDMLRSKDDGESWEPIFEEYATASIGDVTISPSDPDTPTAADC